MATIYCPKEESLEAIIQKIKEAQEESLTLSIEKGSVYWQNKTNESILLQIAQKYNKTIVIDHRAEDDNTPITEVPEVSTTVISDAPKNKTADKKQRKESKLRLWFKFPRVLVIIGFLLLVFVGSASA
ncbi:hypothetical protein KC573_04525, partial [candidate division WWE3 bacterium]|nr:hypothetical protein [candidate division WWE3 bacterium]